MNAGMNAARTTARTTARPRSRKRGRPRDETLSRRRCEEILAVATRYFAGRGYRNTDVQEIADDLGVGKGTIYRYFSSKRDLFLAAADRGMRQLREEVEAARSRVADPLDQVAAAIRAYLRFFDTRPELVELLIQERAEFRDRKKPTYFEHRDANVGRWKRLFRGLIREGRVRRVPVDRITDVASFLVYGTMFTNFFLGRKTSSERQAADVIDILFNGLLSERQRRAR
jgi:AcrR family transcriptional regulator